MLNALALLLQVRFPLPDCGALDRPYGIADLHGTGGDASGHRCGHADTDRSVRRDEVVAEEMQAHGGDVVSELFAEAIR